MADASTSNTPPVIKDEPNEAVDLENRIIELCEQFPKGVSDAMIQTSVPHITPQQRVQALNRLLSLGRIDLLKVGEQLLYKVRSSDASKVKGGDHQEKLVYQIIEEAGSKGIWIRDIRYKSNLLLTQVNKILKSLESKKLIKAVKSVAASKKKVYMLYNVEPDRSVTGGAWYSDQDFESEFVDVLNQQCFKFLNQKAATAQEAKSDPILQRNSSFASCKEVWKFISELGISKVNLSAEDIETILDTLIFDGKVERILVASTDGQTKLYRAVSPLVMHTGLMKSPCGVCPVISQCSEGALVSPSTCTYMKDWLDL